jgi:hypothetical protein
MATPFGQEGSGAARKLGSAFGQAGSYVDSMGTPFGQTSKSTKPRTKASDTSKMNKVYKPKASPGPAANTLNLYGAPKPNFSYSAPKADKVKPKAKSKPKSNFTYSAPKAPKAKSKNVAGFKPGSIGAKAIGSFKKAYLGK